MELQDKIKGGLFGVAIGDALGATVEFMSSEEIKEQMGRHTEITGGGWLSLEPGETTDDTAMMLAVAKGIIANPERPIPEIGKHFVEWFQSNPKSMGKTVKHSIENFLNSNNWGQASAKTSEQLNGRTDGNGSLMRTLPVAFAYRNNKVKMGIFSGQVSRMTHHSVDAEISCIFYNRFAVYLLEGNDKKEAFELAYQDIAPLSKLPQGKKLPAILQAVSQLKREHLRPTGYVIDTIIAAVVPFMTFDSFEEIVIEAVNLGGDADTIGAVAGGLAGTFYGYDAIPKRWINPLFQKEALMNIASELVQLEQR